MPKAGGRSSTPAGLRPVRYIGMSTSEDSQYRRHDGGDAHLSAGLRPGGLLARQPQRRRERAGPGAGAEDGRARERAVRRPWPRRRQHVRPCLGQAAARLGGRDSMRPAGRRCPEDIVSHPAVTAAIPGRPSARTWRTIRAPAGAGCPTRRCGGASSSSGIRSRRRPSSNAFFNVRRDEVAPLLVSAFYFCCVLTAHGVMRPARDALGMRGGLDAIRWLFIGTALVTLAVNPMFGWLVSRFRRMVFIAATYLVLRRQPGRLLPADRVAPGAVGETQRPGLLRLVQRLQPVRHDGVLGADGRPLLARAEQAALRRDRRGRHAGRHRRPWLACTLAKPLGTPALLLVVGRVPAAWRCSPRGWWRGCSRSATPRRRPRGAEPTTNARDRRQRLGRASARCSSRATCSASRPTCCSSTVIATFIYFTRLQMVAALGDDTRHAHRGVRADRPLSRRSRRWCCSSS